MSTPFLVLASRRACSEAELYGIPVLENVVEKAIAAGRVNGEGPKRIVHIDDDLAAHTVTTPNRTGGGRRKLLVTHLETRNRPGGPNHELDHD